MFWKVRPAALCGSTERGLTFGVQAQLGYQSAPGYPRADKGPRLDALIGVGGGLHDSRHAQIHAEHAPANNCQRADGMHSSRE